MDGARPASSTPMLVRIVPTTAVTAEPNLRITTAAAMPATMAPAGRAASESP